MSRKRVTEWLMALVVGSLAVAGGVYFLDQKEEPPAPSSMPMSAAAIQMMHYRINLLPG